jgi:hypothetical protein
MLRHDVFPSLYKNLLQGFACLIRESARKTTRRTSNARQNPMDRPHAIRGMPAFLFVLHPNPYMTAIYD